MFIIASIENVIKNKFSYNNKATKIELKNTIIKLPVSNEKIDFDFMESFIKELKTTHIKKIEQYLLITGLNDYKLTTEEEQIINDFENGNFIWGEFCIEDLFEINNTLSFNKDKLVEGYEYDYVTRTSQNQGILQQTGFVNNENINSSDNWSLGLLQMDFFYRHKKWYAGQFVRKISIKNEVTRNEILYFTVALNKLKQKLLTVLVRDVDKTFLSSNIKLPINNNNEINYKLINNLISAVQKLVIKDVVLYSQNK